MRRKRTITITILLLVVMYLGSYLVFRARNQERWDLDGRTYVIFPPENRAIYYFYRPLTYIDQALTGIRFHIGPHRDPHIGSRGSRSRESESIQQDRSRRRG